MTDNELEPTVRALRQLSPQSQSLVASTVKQLAERESVDVPSTATPGLKSPTEGIPLWVAKLKAERYSERTIHMYKHLVRRYLKQNPTNHRKGNEPLECAMR